LGFQAPQKVPAQPKNDLTMEWDISKLFEQITWIRTRNVLLILVIVATVSAILFKELKPEAKKASHDINISAGTGGRLQIDSSTIINGNVGESRKNPDSTNKKSKK
jgi:hypothetical protein